MGNGRALPPRDHHGHGLYPLHVGLLKIIELHAFRQIHFQIVKKSDNIGLHDIKGVMKYRYRTYFFRSELWLSFQYPSLQRFDAPDWDFQPL